MSRLVDNKRKRAEPAAPGLVDAERTVLNVIKSKRDMGIWLRDIKRESNLPETVVNKAIKSLQNKNKIKDVVNVQNKGRKHFMAVEFEPSKEVTGGEWYSDGNLDTDLITELRRLCLTAISKLKVKVVTAEVILDFINKAGTVNFQCTSKQIAEILNSMVLDNEIIEVKSTGLGEFHSIPVGTVCYRSVKGQEGGKGPRIGAMASIPCGACPRISQCTPDGIISPTTCVYYTKWLDIQF